LHLAHHEYGRSNCYKYPHLGDWQQQKLTKAGASWEVPLLAVEVSGDRKLTQISEATYVLNMISSIHLQLSASCLLPTPIVVGMSCQKHFRQEEPFTGASGQGGGVTEICFHLVRKNARRVVRQDSWRMKALARPQPRCCLRTASQKVVLALQACPVSQ